MLKHKIMNSIKTILVQCFSFIFLLTNVAQIQGQIPNLVEWYGYEQMSTKQCIQAAEFAMDSVGLTNYVTINEEKVSGGNNNVQARILCIETGDSVFLSIVVANTNTWVRPGIIYSRLLIYFLRASRDEPYHYPQDESSSRIRDSYYTKFDTLFITQNGNSVTGIYEDRNGSLHGTIKGNVLHGTWSNSASQKMGRFRFVFDNDYSGFNGRWGYNHEPMTRIWNGR